MEGNPTGYVYDRSCWNDGRTEVNGVTRKFRKSESKKIRFRDPLVSGIHTIDSTLPS